MTEAADQHTSAREMTCPTCNARQVWSDECRRCKTDLSLLRQVWLTAEHERRRCLCELADGQPLRALQHARAYSEYVGHEQAQRLLIVCHLLSENWHEAIRR